MTEETARRIAASPHLARLCAKCGRPFDEIWEGVYHGIRGVKPLICLECFALGYPIQTRLLLWGFERWHSGGNIFVYRREVDRHSYDLVSNLEGEEPVKWEDPVIVGRYAVDDEPTNTFMLDAPGELWETVNFPTLFEYILHLGTTEQRMICLSCHKYFGVPHDIDLGQEPEIDCPHCYSPDVEEAR